VLIPATVPLTARRRVPPFHPLNCLRQDRRLRRSLCPQQGQLETAIMALLMHHVSLRPKCKPTRILASSSSDARVSSFEPTRFSVPRISCSSNDVTLFNDSRKRSCIQIAICWPDVRFGGSGIIKYHIRLLISTNSKLNLVY
jgi:hypothetical protein